MKRIGIIGCGNMGEAILKGILSKKLVSCRDVSVADIDSAKLHRTKKAYNVNATFNSSVVAKQSDVIIIAVKPQDIALTLNSISECLNKRKLLISIAAGITIKKIAAIVGGDIPIIRVMPNMPALIGKGFSAISFQKKIDKNFVKFAKAIFGSIGEVVELNERGLDAVTAISGSGPAYFFYLIELLIKSGVKLGLSHEVAKSAAVQTAIGSAELLLRFGKDPSSLRKKVASKGGTTEAAFKVFKKNNLERLIQKGIEAAKRRSKELSRG